MQSHREDKHKVCCENGRDQWRSSQETASEVVDKEQEKKGWECSQWKNMMERFSEITTRMFRFKNTEDLSAWKLP